MSYAALPPRSPGSSSSLPLPSTGSATLLGDEDEDIILEELLDPDEDEIRNASIVSSVSNMANT